MAAPRRAAIKYPKGTPKADIKGNNLNSEWFEEFWKLNKKNLIKQYKYFTEEYHKPDEEIKKYMESSVIESIQYKNYGTGRFKKTRGVKAAVSATLRKTEWGGQRDTAIENFKTGIKYFGNEPGNKKLSETYQHMLDVTRGAKGRFQKIYWDTLTEEKHNIFTVKLQDGRTLVIMKTDSPRAIYFQVVDDFNVTDY